MKTQTKLWIGAGALTAVLVAGAALAQGHRGGMRGMFMRHAIEGRIADAEDFIDATPEQRQVIDGAKAEVLQALDARMQAGKGMHGQLAALLTADKLDTDKLYALADQRAADIKDLSRVIVPQIAKVHDALTPAQRQKLYDHFQKKQARMQGGFGGE